MRLDLYKYKAKIFADNMSQTKTLAAELNMNDAASNADKILARLGTESFRLVIVGEFSRGKSTFVNALLGRRILPASKNPTTAIISKIIYGAQPDYYIFRKNSGTPQRLSEEDFIKLTAPKEPDADDLNSVREFEQKQKAIAEIDHAEIRQPLAFCKDNVEVIDTPGTNDLNVGRMEITYGYLNQADACILVLSATQPLSKSEAEFLKERILGNKIQDIFFVISRKDQFGGNRDEENRVISYVEENLRNILPKNFNLGDKVFLVSSLQALLYRRNANGEALKPKQTAQIPKSFSDTGFIELEDALGDFIANEKGAIKLRRYVEDARAVIQTMSHDLSVNIGVVAHSTDEIRRKVAKLEPRFKDAHDKADKIIADLKSQLERIGGRISDKCETGANSIRIHARAAVNYLDSSMSNDEMKNSIERAVKDEKSSFINSMISDWQKTFDAANEKTLAELRQIFGSIDVEYRREFNLPATIGEVQLSIDIDRRESFSQRASAAAGRLIGRAFDSTRGFFDRVVNFFGGVAAGIASGISSFFGGGSSSQRDWREELRSQIDKDYRSLGGSMSKELTKQYNQRSAEMCESFKRSVDARLKDMERQLKEILREKESKEQDAQRRQKYLEQKRAELQLIERNLDEVLK